MLAPFLCSPLTRHDVVYAYPPFPSGPPASPGEEEEKPLGSPDEEEDEDRALPSWWYWRTGKEIEYTLSKSCRADKYLAIRQKYHISSHPSFDSGTNFTDPSHPILDHHNLPLHTNSFFSFPSPSFHLSHVIFLTILPLSSLPFSFKAPPRQKEEETHPPFY